MRTGSGGGIGRDIVAMRIGHDSVPRPLLAEKYNETVPALSPDGRWLAYVSNETGREEVFVRPFPDVNSGKWQVSLNGGVSPVWANSGRELFFVNDSMAVVSQAVRPGASFDRGELRTLFRLEINRIARDITYPMFDVSPDDRRLMFVRAVDVTASADAPVLIIVENWLEEVKAKMRRR
jgi:eukaryotic-like serine/threonine-protein kinase